MVDCVHNVYVICNMSKGFLKAFLYFGLKHESKRTHFLDSQDKFMIIIKRKTQKILFATSD